MSSARKGIWLGLGAYLLWGLLPVYWKALRTVPAPEILMHRIVWSFGFLALLIILSRQGRTLFAAATQRRTLAIYLGAALLLGLNWFVYIWAVNHNRIVETSLGYYINPLVSVALGVVVLRERLGAIQWVAVGIAALGVLFLTWQYGAFPWVAVVLALSFACYGLIKKTAPLPALPGLTIETALLWLPAAGYLGALESQGIGHFGQSGGWGDSLLVLTGVVTALPLLLFASAARLVKLSTLGLLQYVSPTCGLILGVAVYGEPFPRARALGFGIIWLALAVYWLAGRAAHRPALGAS
ncbi:MAG TPA: EamA family transporter RarD [Verrucomicrobiota bacterium]|nr:EamA family transporter RarD [Verrucomicrobiota bacterium]